MLNTNTAAYWINHLQLRPHPEGGYYREVFRSDIAVSREAETVIKQACTSIYYLLAGDDYSGFHRLKSDELWYFHKGAPLHIHAIDPEGNYVVHELSDADTGQLSIAITAGTWFGSNIPSKKDFVLVSCAVAPGFDFIEFEMAGQEMLAGMYPQHNEIINRLCRC